MKKRSKRALLLLSFILLTITYGFAKQRTSLEALDIANTFSQKYQSTLTRSSNGKVTINKLVFTCKDHVTTRSTNENGYYYVVNIGDEKGFVIVSGDDRAKEILGYSDSGSFPTLNLPENFKNWMAAYETELRALAEVADDTTFTTVATTLRTTKSNIFAPNITPLLGTLKWDQAAPYNLFCPFIDSIQAPTGCVATAMAQVMKYHQWPVTGTGKKTYKASEVKDSLSVDFSKTTYNWVNMSNVYDGYSNTPSQDTAVATLMFHCGVAVSMEYSANSSGAFSNEIAAALIDYFGYDSNAQIFTRDYYTEAEWVGMMKKELNTHLPIIYGGSSLEGSGHQFICDGYDTNNLFHFNWGWSGVCNGYFELSSLNVMTPGIGGGNGGYSIGQDMVLGIQKPTVTSVKTYQLFIYKLLEVDKPKIARDSIFNLTTGFVNFGGNTFNGTYGLGLYLGDSLVSMLNENNVTLPTYYGDTNFSADSLSIPNSLANGRYQIYGIYKASGQSSWTLMRYKVGTPNSLNVTVTSSDVTFSTPEAYPKLTLMEPIKVIGNIYSGKTTRVSATIQNTGTEYNSYLILQLCSPLDGKILQLINYDPINIPAGTTKKIELTGNIHIGAGNYVLNIYFDKNNNQDNYVLDLLSPGPNNSVSVSVINSSTVAPELRLIEKMTLADSTLFIGSKAILTAKIKNTGGFFNRNLMAYIFPQNDQYAIDYIGPLNILIDTNEEKIITLSKEIDLAEGTYKLKLYHSNDSITNNWDAFTPGTSSVLQFTVSNLQTVVEKPASDRPMLYPNPAKEAFFVQSATLIKSIEIMEISGNRILKQTPLTNGTIPVNVFNLSKGVYLVKIKTEDGTYTEIFVKK